MTIPELTAAMHDFVRSKGWYSADSQRLQTPRNLAISLSLETAEVLEHFQWGDDVSDRQAFPAGNRAGHRGPGVVLSSGRQGSRIGLAHRHVASCIWVMEN